MDGTDGIRFDNASLAILERVNYAVALLERSAGPRAVLEAEASPATGDLNTSPSIFQNNGPPMTPYSNINAVENTTSAAGETITDKLSVNTRCACTHVLEWPIFGGLVKPSSVNPALYGEDTQSPRVAQNSGTSLQHGVRLGRSAARIDEGDVQELVQAFLHNVHIKNPILERTELLRLARIVAEDGFKWDACSCLVLLACALGGISATWEVAIPSGSECSFGDMASHDLADAYYTAARKRIGLLETSNQATQCWFLLGMLEMYLMRPLNGWASFSRACNLLELRLYTQSQHDLQGFTRAERRLYWSCLKSEAELREEFDLPEPGLARIEHAYVLPSPPESTPDSSNGASISDSAWETVQEQSWYYYLSDIAYRRITNRTIAALYNVPKEQWLHCSISRLYYIAEELDAQVLQWWDTIPGSPTPECRADTDELTYMLYLNYADLRERIWRPFVYIAIHAESSEANALLVAGASKCIEMSIGMLENALLKHRHHGCWQTIRCMFSKALVILAAARSLRVQLPSEWRYHIEAFQKYMQYWQAEAPDIGVASQALTTLLPSLGDN